MLNDYIIINFNIGFLFDQSSYFENLFVLLYEV